jgi:hypothetical protein
LLGGWNRASRQHLTIEGGSKDARPVRDLLTKSLLLHIVIPAKAGIQWRLKSTWILAFAGTTEVLLMLAG